MLDLEENKRNLINIENRFNSIGGSLWHRFFRSTIKRVWKQNFRRRFLDKSNRIK